jgi:hypothetical protein
MIQIEREKLEQVLEALESALSDDQPYIVKCGKAITAIEEALAQPVQEPTCPECKAAVLYECVACSSNNYPPKPVQEPVARTVIAGALFDFMGYLTSRKERIVLSAADDAAPAADAIIDFATKRGLSLDDAQVREWIDALAQPEERNFCPRCGKRTADLITIHTCTPPIAAGSQAFYGFPNGSVSTPNAGGKCVTAGETAPVKEIDPNQWAFDRGLEST